MLRPLRALLERVRAKDPSPRFIFAGDYVNRGPETKNVIELLLTVPDARFVRGNHDDLLDMVLHGRCLTAHPDARTPLTAFLWFSHYGLANTLYSYGVDEMDIEWIRHRPTPDGVRKLISVIPESHRSFIRSLPPVVEDDDLFVIHAMWDPDEPDPSPLADRLAGDVRLRTMSLWGRFAGEITRPKRWRRTGYFGHTPVESYPLSLTRGQNVPIRGPQIVLLDTGAALTPSGRLTAVCAETGEAVQVDRIGMPVHTE